MNGINGAKFLKSLLIFPPVQNPLWMEITSIFFNLQESSAGESVLVDLFFSFVRKSIMNWAKD